MMYKLEWCQIKETKVKYHWLLAVFAIFTLLLSNNLITCAKPAEFEVVSLNITPEVALSADTLTVSVEIKNIGQSEGSYSTVLNVDGAVKETQTITLLPGAYQKVIFYLAEDKAGLHQVSVDKLNVDFKIKEPTLEQLSIDYPELYQELLKLPELKEIDEKDKEAIEEIASLALRPEYRAAFESVLDEGIKDKRKYCTPLQALLWIAYDHKLNVYYPLSALTRLMNFAWKYTTTSSIYKSERWTNFDEVVERLNSPYLISLYTKGVFRYDYERLADLNAGNGSALNPLTPKQMFETKKGVCYDYANFELYCLMNNGYVYDSFGSHADGAACHLEAWDPFGSAPIGQRGHHTCLFIQSGLFYIIDTAGPISPGIRGPFKTIEEAADATWPEWKSFKFLDQDSQITKTVTR